LSKPLQPFPDQIDIGNRWKYLHLARRLRSAPLGVTAFARCRARSSERYRWWPLQASARVSGRGRVYGSASLKSLMIPTVYIHAIW